jgi:hypothetical protein
MDMNDRTLLMVMMQGIGANSTNDKKRAHLIDLKREHLIRKFCHPKIVFGLSTIIKQFQLDIAGTPICGAYATTPYIPPVGLNEANLNTKLN